ncbi:Hypothetical predicted protein, partial [Drosophila guanche]
IQQQRLIKFPEEFDPNVAPPTAEKVDEAKRILEQIARVNEAFGYVKKQPEQKKLPPILDSSQYLFPKPAYQPFHAQQHHFAGSHGQTLLEPSIRAVKLTRNVAGSSYNVPPRLRKGTVAPASVEVQQSQLYFRPNQVELPKPTTAQEAQQLPAHFVIPVHLYKLNKEQYLREHAAQEYRVKGYKIIGDVDSFYGKAKSGRKQGKTTPKYHLFFLPRELALNEDGTPKRGNGTATTKAPAAPQNFKEFRLDSRERPSNKPAHRTQTTVAAATDNSLAAAGNRKRVSTTVKPVRGAASAGGKDAEQLSPTIATTSAPSSLPPAGGLLPNRNRLNPFRVSGINIADMQNQTSSAIKNAFQNIFRMPFRPVPGALSPSQPIIVGSIPQKHQQQQLSSDTQEDYKWDDEKEEGGGDGNIEDLENTAAEQDTSAQSEEKHLFAHKNHLGTGGLMHTIGHVATAQQTTQKQALREGGIIIQRLKVRKGGIAIAGPGGVATAGSGGTAIVGPGGYALTHPRSLTIAGPGAKVISIPANVDLQDALARTDLQARSFPREGKVVATGPTVYYAPPTGTTEEEEEEQEMMFDAYGYWRTASFEAWPPRTQLAHSAPLLAKENQPTPFGAYQPAVIYNSPFYAAYSLPLAYVLQPTTPGTATTPATADATTTSTIKPESIAEELEKPEKLQELPAETQTTGDLKSDSGLRSAVSKINPNYVIEEILSIPGKHVISSQQQLRPAKLRKSTSVKPKRVPVKVEATGKTSSSSGNIPQIQFGNYFLPYQPLQAQAIQGRKQAALILEPHSRAVVGNGGTAISTPISRAYLKKGVPTNVYFNPDSVAIAGVGGKAHATADLELDLFN